MGGKNDITALSEKVGGLIGQASPESGKRIIYPAIVRDVDDKAFQNRLKAEIVSIDESGKIKGGKDKNTPLEKLPLCIPFLPEFLHVRPKVGEAVLLIIENPKDMTSPRYWIGPIKTSQIKMEYESYEEANNIFNRSTFKQQEIGSGKTNEKDIKASTVIPKQQEISVQGRNDADITFKKREVVIRAGKFKKQTIDINETHPCKIQLKQYDESDQKTSGALSSLINNISFSPFSQTNIISTNINLISTEGKNRNPKSKTVETTTNKKNLERFGETANQLHPLVFGDELINLLKIMINFMLTHIHTPQNPAVSPLEGISQLSSYKTDEKIQEIISKNVRTN